MQSDPLDRNKLEPENNKSLNARAEEHHRIHDIVVPEAENSSVAAQVEVPPWAESYEISSTTDMEGKSLRFDTGSPAQLYLSRSSVGRRHRGRQASKGKA